MDVAVTEVEMAVDIVAEADEGEGIVITNHTTRITHNGHPILALILMTNGITLHTTTNNK